MIWKLISWYLILVLLGWITFLFTYRLFSKLTGHGFMFSRSLGFLLWGFIFWLLGSLGVLQNQPGGILFALFLLVAVSFWVGWSKRGEILTWIKSHWRMILMAECVFLLSFVFMLIVRAGNPDATGTEKPMELAFINAVIKSNSIPPHDPWLSGYAISYYHFGYILTGMLAKLTHTSGGLAFNLMLSITFAMSALGAYGILLNLISPADTEDRKFKKSLLWALLGPLFLLFVSNLEPILELFHQAGIGWDLATGTSQFWSWINLNSLNTPPSPPLTVIPQRFWWWWQSSRVIQDIDFLGNVSGLSPIDEFPAFSFVLGDLHPHVLVMPYAMLLIGIALNVFRGGMDMDWKLFGKTIPYRWDMFLICAILLGGIAFLNTWDLPVYFALLTVSFLLNRVRRKGWHKQQVKDFLILAVPLGVSSILLYLPFYLSFQSQAGGILPNLIYPTRGLYLWLMFGTLFIPMFLLFIWLKKSWRNAFWGWGAGLTGIIIIILALLAVALGFVVAQTSMGLQVMVSQEESTFLGFLSASFTHRLMFGFSLVTLALLMTTGLAFLLGCLRQDQDEHRPEKSISFIMLLIVLGTLMVIVPEFLYLLDNFGTRMNTIFKFYYQAWMLWSIASAYASVMILRKGKWLSKTIIVLVILMGLVFPVLAYPSKTNQFSIDREAALDASAYIDIYLPDEAAAIRWLSQQPTGAVVEAVGGQYSGYARVSTHSGQPAVLGWPGHEGQWRGGYEEVGNRENDIRILYETQSWDTALNIIRQYDVRYIFLGSLEQSTYFVNSEKFTSNLGYGFEQGGVEVYIIPETLLEDQ